MKITNYFTILILFIAALSSCSEEEVQVFSSERGINFILYDTLSGEYTDDYEELKYEHNYFKDYPDAGWNLPDVCMAVGIQLEGAFSDEPVTVKIKAEAVDGYDMPDIEFPAECVIPVGEYRANFLVKCKKPQVMEKEYKAVLVFDYDASRLVAGTKERQKYEITISDKSIWDDMYVANETEWNSVYSDVLGDYGPVKGRAVLVSCGKSSDSGAVYSFGANYGATYDGIMRYYYNTKMGSYTNSFKYFYQTYYLYYGLALYQENYGKELTEADGTIVSFKILE